MTTTADGADITGLERTLGLPGLTFVIYPGAAHEGFGPALLVAPPRGGIALALAVVATRRLRKR